MRKLTVVVLGFVLALAAAPVQAAIITFTSSAAFQAAVPSAIVESYESSPVGTLIPNGVYNGVVYTFPAGTQGRIDATYNRIGASSLALDRDGNPATPDFFFAGESLTVVFPTPVTAVGIFFNVYTSPFGSLFISTPVGMALTGGPAYDTGTLYFAGLISDTPFATATFGATNAAASGYNLDELHYQPVPEPATLGLLVGGLAGLAGRRRLHRR